MSLRVERKSVEITRDSTPLSIGDMLAFVEDGDFLNEFFDCGMDSDDLDFVQFAITIAPTGGDVVPVSSSIRDCIYVGPESSAVVRYIYLEPVNTVLLLTAYPGTESLHMTGTEAMEAEAYVEAQLDYFATWNEA